MRIIYFAILPFFLLILSFTNSVPQNKNAEGALEIKNMKPTSGKDIVTGADQTAKYLPLLKGKNVAMTINNTSTIGGKLSLDSLLSLGIKVVKGFAAEHGFRGKAPNGAEVRNETDEKSGIPIISIYGEKNKPSKEDLAGIDVMIFDMQDVGVRFYTFLTTLHYVMEACAENNVELIVLDRPNPNDFYVDGPVLDENFKSFVGIDPIPAVHGMTFGEYAMMLNGEGWLLNKVKCKLHVIEMLNYQHGKSYILPIPPSPNLNTQQSILLYPSLCFFEGTAISQGRGTYFPFQVLGSPELKGKYTFSFKPVSIKGMSENPPQLNMECYGLDLRKYNTDIFYKTQQINLSWLIEFYNAYPNKDKFFNINKNGMFRIDRLAGTNKLREQIIAGKSEKEIRDSWEPALSQYKEIRRNYLIYK
jgi:uncharacterized protein YbbC (DUF1343 family)